MFGPVTSIPATKPAVLVTVTVVLLRVVAKPVKDMGAAKPATPVTPEAAPVAARLMTNWPPPTETIVAPMGMFGPNTSIPGSKPVVLAT